MSEFDYSTINSPEEADLMIRLLVERSQELAEIKVSRDALRRERIAQSVSELRWLIGEESQPPYDPGAWEAEQVKPEAERNQALRPTLLSVLKHPQSVLAEFTGLVHDLNLNATLIVARVSLDMVLVMGEG